MIKGISFSELNDDQIISNTKEYNPKLLSEKHFTHIKNDIVLPYECYPNMIRNDGIFADNLTKLYNTYYNLNEKKNDTEKISLLIRNEIINRWQSGKQGRWRKDICGKRSNYTARSVLSPNPNLSLVQIGLPIQWKRYLTLTEKFKYESNFKIVAVLNSAGKKFDPKFLKPTPNNMIIRELNNGDLVIVNRQPTLRTSNFVAMEIIWVKEKTIQMHPALFSSFDGDCDGDEINIHLPQIDQNLLNSLHIKHSIYNLGKFDLSPSIIQDALVGLCLHNKYKNKSQVHSIVTTNDNITTLCNIKNAYIEGLHNVFYNGFSPGFDFCEVDFMIKTGAKGKNIHKEKIRRMLKGIYNDEEHFEECMAARKAMISTSLKTAETGYISRRMAYHLDDVTQENGICKDYNKMILHFPSKVPNKLRYIRNIGLYMVEVFMPPLTQKMLDSFHRAASGESTENDTKHFVSLINCTSKELKIEYETKGILMAKRKLKSLLSKFFENDVHIFWIELLCDFMCINGELLGFGLSTLKKRIDMYQKFNDTITIPILKYCKFGNPHNVLKIAAQNEIFDNLESNHSKEIFF